MGEAGYPAQSGLRPESCFYNLSPESYVLSPAFQFVSLLPWQLLYFFPLPQGQGSLRPTFGPSRRIGAWEMRLSSQYKYMAVIESPIELAASLRISRSSSALGIESPASSAASRMRPDSSMNGNSSSSTRSGSPCPYQSVSDNTTPSR